MKGMRIWHCPGGCEASHGGREHLDEQTAGRTLYTQKALIRYLHTAGLYQLGLEISTRAVLTAAFMSLRGG